MKLRWDTLVGHEGAVAALRQLVRRGTVPHAFLFTGPGGVGKARLAKTLAAALLCPQAEAPCGVCPACRQVAAEEHPQLQVVRPEGTAIKISQIRNLLPRLSLCGGGERFFVLLDGAEAMNQEAANSLLKMLEEPPPGVFFLLVAERPEQLLPTVRSRCRLVRLQGLPAAVLAAVLQQRGWEARDASLAAQVAAGSLAEALAFLEEGRRQLRDEVWQALQAGAGAVWTVGESWGKEERPRAQLRLRYLSLLLRDMLVVRQEAAVPLFHPDLADSLRREGAGWSAAGLMQAVAAVEETRRNLRFHVVLRLALEALWLRLSEAKEDPGLCRK